MPDPVTPPATWHAQLPDTLTYEDNGKAVPLREHPAIKETADVPTLAKRFFDNHVEMGGEMREVRDHFADINNMIRSEREVNKQIRQPRDDP